MQNNLHNCRGRKRGAKAHQHGNIVPQSFNKANLEPGQAYRKQKLRFKPTKERPSFGKR